MVQQDQSDTEVGHCKIDETDEYIGRGTEGRNFNTAMIGARGWLGNPHPLDDNTREESIDLFREDFEAKLVRDGDLRDAVRDLAGQTLGCWCRTVDDDEPACHGDVVAEHADRLANQEPGARGSPDDRLIFDISAVDECDVCGWSPAAIILVGGDWECYNCGVQDYDE